MKRASLTILCVIACEKSGAAPTVPSEAPPTSATAVGSPEVIDTNCEPDVLGEDAANRFAFEDNGLWGFKDGAGKVVIAAQYMMVTPFTKEGVAGVIGEGGPAFIDVEGRRLATAMMFDNGPDYFVQGLARIVDGDKTGFIDRAGRVVIPPRFDAAGSFCEDLAPVCMGCKEVPRGEHSEMVGGQWGFVDRGGVIAIPIAYDSANGFIEGGATVGKGGRTFRIDRRGAELAAE